MNFSAGQAGKAKAWKDIWGSGQGIGAVDQILPVKKLVDKLNREYTAARLRLGYSSNLVTSMEKS